MLTITLPERELFNEKTSEFINIPAKTLQMEHSLISLSKWESKWKKPFFDSKKPKTRAETVDYYRCMTITKNVNPEDYLEIPYDIDKKIMEYIYDRQTATTINHKKQPRGKSEKLTAELIYYYMTAFNIPFSCERWHLSRLLTLIEICSLKSGPTQKMSKRDTLKQNAALNAARRARSGSRG